MSKLSSDLEGHRVSCPSMQGLFRCERSSMDSTWTLAGRRSRTYRSITANSLTRQIDMLCGNSSRWRDLHEVGLGWTTSPTATCFFASRWFDGIVLSPNCLELFPTLYIGGKKSLTIRMSTFKRRREALLDKMTDMWSYTNQRRRALKGCV